MARATTGHALWHALAEGFLTADVPHLSNFPISLRGHSWATIFLVIKTGMIALVIENILEVSYRSPIKQGIIVGDWVKLTG